MSTPLRLLLLEDNPADAELMVREVRRAGFDLDWQRVENEPDFLTALNPIPDLILSDYNLPQFDGLAALALVIERGLDIPFILVSGTIGEELAVEALKMGAADYLLKDRMTRLGQAVLAALKEKEERQKRQAAEVALRESQMQVMGIINSAMDAIISIDTAQNILLFNPAAEDMFLCDSADAIGRPLEHFLPERFRASHAQHIQRFSQAGVTSRAMGKLGTIYGIRTNGEEFPIEASISQTQAAGEKIFTVILRDITERKRIEDALHWSEERFRSWIENSSDLVTVIGQDGTIQYASPSYERILGYDPQMLIGTSGFDLVHPDDFEQMLEIFTQGIQISGSSAIAEFRYLHCDGSWRIFESLGKVYTDGQGQLAGLINSRDITERKQTQKHNESQLRRFAALHAIDSAITSTLDLSQTLDVVLLETTTHLQMDAACVLLLDPHTHYVSYAAGRGFRTPVIETTNVPFHKSFVGRANMGDQIVDMHDLAQLQDMPLFTALCTSEGFSTYYAIPLISQERTIGILEVFHRTHYEADDEWLYFLEILAGQAAIAVENASLFTETQRLLQQTQIQAQLTQEIIDSAPEGMLVLDSQLRLVLANPTVRRYLPMLAEVAVGDILTTLGDHRLADFLHSFGDAQPWQEARWGHPPRVYEVASQPLSVGQQAGGWVLVVRDVTIERDRQRYQQAQDRLATVGQLAAGIAHDFNNIMGSIILYTQLVRNDPRLSAKHQQYLGVIHEQSHHAANLIRQILDFSRSAPMEKTALDAAVIIKELVKLLERTLPENVQIELTYDRNEYIISGDPTRLQQMLMNLAFNARDAMPRGGTLAFRLAALTVTPSQAPPLPDMGAGEWMQLAVSDTGSGIESQHLPHLFEPFFTTKEPGQGTGLGLAQVYGIVKQHDGSIAVESQVGVGTTFTVYLPLHDAPSPPAPYAPANESLLGAGERILLVEDNPAMRMAVSDSLEGLGYQVFSAADGVEALEILAQQAEAILLMISDLVMPRMGGVELAQTARLRYPTLKILIMTGHPLGESEEELRQSGIQGWIQKPFSISELSDYIQSLLEKPQ